MGEIILFKINVKNYMGFLICKRILWIDDLDFYIKLLFIDFVMYGNCKDNYVYLENVILSGMDLLYGCCKKSINVLCVFGNGIGVFFLVYIDKNFMIVNYVFMDLKLLIFLVKWFNVNGNFFYSFILEEDLDWVDKLKILGLKFKNIEDDIIDVIYIVVVVIFFIIVFVVLVILLCKVGWYFLGFCCSVVYCCSWIVVRWCL